MTVPLMILGQLLADLVRSATFGNRIKECPSPATEGWTWVKVPMLFFLTRMIACCRMVLRTAWNASACIHPVVLWSGAIARSRLTVHLLVRPIGRAEQAISIVPCYR